MCFTVKITNISCLPSNMCTYTEGTGNLCCSAKVAKHAAGSSAETNLLEVCGFSLSLSLFRSYHFLIKYVCLYARTGKIK